MIRSNGYALHCPRCDYLLTGLPEPRCPECGSTFDPSALLEEACRRDREFIRGRAELIRRARFTEVLLVQSLIAILFSLTLDGGRLLTLYLIALAAYWGGVCVYVARHSAFPTRRLTLIRVAWLPAFMLAIVVVVILAR